MKVLLLIYFAIGVITGFIFQILNEIETRKAISNASENDFQVNQKRKFDIIQSYDETFNLCLEFCQTAKAKINSQDFLSGTINAKTGIVWKAFGWNTFGHKLNFNISKVTEELTEIEVQITPKMPITLMDGGEALKIIKAIEEFFQAANDRKNVYRLEEKTEIPIDFYADQIISGKNTTNKI